MRVLHIENEHIALEQYTVPAEYSSVNIWTAKHLWLPISAKVKDYLENSI
ncbi:hypothetical protein L584_18280 [Pantoea agglomerans Tx10]|jgi:predicted RNA methylase|nr:hypothetical protein L584_18280 [Pantoea agglomerans Tx10]